MTGSIRTGTRAGYRWSVICHPMTGKWIFELCRIGQRQDLVEHNPRRVYRRYEQAETAAKKRIDKLTAGTARGLLAGIINAEMAKGKT